jgi:hypothetical protein
LAWNVHLHVVFSCDANDSVAAVAKRHRERLHDEDCREAAWFLDDLSERTGKNDGPKGGQSLWGITGNHTDVGAFIEALLPFFKELLESPVDNGPSDYEHILVFYEPEQQEAAGAYEIYRDNWGNGPVVVAHHERLPFSFGQM